MLNRKLKVVMANPKLKLFFQVRFHFVYIIALWLLLTGINITKAYHIDDSFHLEAAEYIGQHPLKPMSGSINWDQSPTQLYKGNQPPIFFYLIYVHQLLFGNSEISLHLLLSVFTFLSLIYFYKLTEIINVKSPLTILTIFAFCPAFIVNQNLMMDIPILALSLSIMYYLLKGQLSDNIKYYLISVILLTIGLLIKYTLLPLFFVITITILLTKSYKKCIILVIPLIALLFWSIWNFIEFGFIHILSIIDRRKSELEIITMLDYVKNIFGFIVTLGAIATFTATFIYNILPKKVTRYFIILVFILLIISVALVYSKIIEEAKFNFLLKNFFLINGFILILLILNQALKSFFRKKYEYFGTPYFVIITYLLSVSVFIVLFAPFNATRHTLLLLPFILLFGHRQFESTRGIINNFTITISILLGILLGISDWIFADFYRKNVNSINTRENRVWSVGHWGWQWYSKKAGMLIYSKNNDFNIRKNDLVVFPKNIHKQHLSEDIRLDPVRFITEAPTFFTFFSGKIYASMYSSTFDNPPWSLSSAAIDTIFIYKVRQEIGIDEVVNRIRSDEIWLNNIKNKSIENYIPIDSMLIIEARLFIEQKRKD